MFPLVSTLLELRKAKMVLSDVMEDLEEEGIPFKRDILGRNDGRSSYPRPLWRKNSRAKSIFFPLEPTT